LGIETRDTVVVAELFCDRRTSLAHGKFLTVKPRIRRPVALAPSRVGGDDEPAWVRAQLLKRDRIVTRDVQHVNPTAKSESVRGGNADAEPREWAGPHPDRDRGHVARRNFGEREALTNEFADEFCVSPRIVDRAFGEHALALHDRDA